MNWIMIAALMLSLGAAEKNVKPADDVKPTTEETFFDFGHIGIDYTLYHRFPFVNRTPDTIHIVNVHVPCDCTNVIAIDTVIAPGDSTTLNLKFSTKDFYGPQNKSFRVDTDSPIHGLDHVEYFYLSIIGQWFDGITPDPLALFFLPPHKEKSLEIPNKLFDQLSIGDVYSQDDYFTVDTPKRDAAKGESLKVVVRPSPDLRAGTYHSNFTLTIDKSDDSQPAILTIPVKIVRY